MCGIAAIVGTGWHRSELDAMVASQDHRGPDARGVYMNAAGSVGLGHNRLSIIDLSASGRQPMSSADERYQIVFNGEIYNYIELRAELGDYPYRTRTDTEVILAAYERWGTGCLDRLIGMFAFAIWDERERRLFAARDRFGVKPLHLHQDALGCLRLASEAQALRATCVDASPDPVAWATYFSSALQDYSPRTFWSGIQSLPGGHALEWRGGAMRIWRWYDVAEHVAAGWDSRSTASVMEEYTALLTESVRWRFRSDVPVGINLSGGLDSSTLLGVVRQVQGPDARIQALTYTTGDSRYDELPWVTEMLSHTQYPSIVCRLDASDVPDLAASVQKNADGPIGGIPTLGYARVFERARAEGTIVLLDGQGMDEQWCGYDYYESALRGEASSVVQGTRERPVRPECLTPEFRALAEPAPDARPFPDALRNVQYRDLSATKIPRALRFHDRVSMRSSTELREPFLDHRLFELALRQPAERKIADGTRKWFLRRVARTLMPEALVEAPKRAVSTPQREWLRGPLAGWAADQIESALSEYGGSWLDADAVRTAWRAYREGGGDNSYYVWQWINLGLIVNHDQPRSSLLQAAARAAREASV